MSIIVAVKKNGRAAMAADTAESDGSLVISARYLVNHSKIVKYKRFYIGIAGWAATADIFEALLRKHGKSVCFDSREQIFESSLAIHKLLKAHYFLETNEDKEQPVESSQLSLLIGGPSGLFELESYRSVTEYTRFWAIGSGKTVALGAMHALFDRFDDPSDIARAAVEAACEFDDACALPLEVQSFKVAKNARVRAKKKS